MTAAHSLSAPELRAAHQPARALYARTATGIVIGAAWLRRPSADTARAITGPHRAADTRGDIAVRWACAVSALALVMLLISERLA